MKYKIKIHNLMLLIVLLSLIIGFFVQQRYSLQWDKALLQWERELDKRQDELDKRQDELDKRQDELDKRREE